MLRGFSAFFLVLAAVLLLATATGCVSEPRQSKPAPRVTDSGDAPIQEIDVLALPVALNLDQKPGPDGFLIKVFATNRKKPKAIAIDEGKIEVFMFDGVLGITQPVTSEPKQTWTYSAKDLKLYEIRSSVGIGYQLSPTWGDAKPAGSKITVGVRYTPPNGRFINSAPSVISVAM